MDLKRSKRLWIGLAIVSMLFVGCMDEKYDLSDIDSDVTVNVKDLTIPVNIDDITLSSVLDLEEDDEIKEINGIYAVVKKGDFHSNAISIDPFVIRKPSITPISADINVQNTFSIPNLPAGITVSLIPAGTKLICFDIASANASTDISLRATNVDASIVSINTIGADAVLTASLQFSGLENFVNDFYIEDLVLYLPKYLNASISDGGVYDKATGKVTFASSLISSQNLSKNITITVKDIYASQAGATLKDGVFSYSSSCKAEGSITVYKENLKPTADINALLQLNKIRYNCSLAFDRDIQITDFSGNVDYTVKGINVDPISLENIPDVLNQTGTQIGLENPQIYVKLNNPLHSMNVSPTADLELIPNPASDQKFKTSITADKADNIFCLSPVRPNNFFSDNESDYSQAQHVAFSNLGQVLYGNRIPTSIQLDIKAFAKQEVNNFHLGNYEPVNGEYTFYAPLQLTDESHIAYEDTIDGWNDEDVDAITISKITINAEVTKDIPYGVTLDFWPINKNGQKIETVKGTATLSKDANKPQPLIINMEGTVTHLDGIIIKAKVDAASTATLAPTMKLKVSNLKAKVSGSYDKEL